MIGGNYMEKLMKQVNDIYAIASSITVRGDAVDAMAAIRAKLRTLYASLKAMETDTVQKETEANGGQDNG